MTGFDRERPLYVEFVGLPGCGKTTILHEIVPVLTEQGYRCVVGRRDGPRVSATGRNLQRGSEPAPTESALRKAIAHGALHLRMWRVSLAAYRYVLATGRWNATRVRMARALLKCVARILAGCGIVRAGRGDLVLFSQGMAAYLRQMNGPESSLATGSLSRLGHHLRRALAGTRCIIVLIEVDAATAAARVEQRPRDLGPWDRMELGERQRRMSEQLPYIERTIELLQTAGALSGVLRLDGTAAPSENTRLLAAYLTERLDVGSAPPIPHLTAPRREATR